MSDPAEDEREWLDLLSASLAESDQVPATLLRDAEASWTWRTIDTELADISYDSSDSALAGAAGVRAAAGGVRQLSLTSAAVTIDLQLDAEQVLGQILGPATPSIRLEQPGADSVTLTVDDLGRFAFRPVPGRAFRLVLADPVPVTTAWISP